LKIDALRWRWADRWPAAIYLLPLLIGLLLARLPLTWAAGLVVGTAVLLLIIIQPLVGLGLALLLSPFGALENVLFGGTVLDSGQMLLLLTLFVWLSRSLRRRQLIIPHTFLNIPFLLFLFIMALTLLNAPSAIIGFKELLKWVEMLLIVWLVIDLGRQKAEGRRLKEGGRLKAESGNRKVIHPSSFILLPLLFAGVVQALVGIWQFGLRGDGPEHFIVMGRFYRAYGTFEQPNPFGGFMNLTALLALGALVGWLVYYWQGSKGARERRPKVVWGREENGSPLLLRSSAPLLLFGGVTAVTITALITSWSRGAWLGFAAGTAVLIFYWPQKRRQGIMMLGLGAVFFLIGMQFNLIPASITERVTSFSQDLQFGDVRGVDINDTNYAVLERLAHWQAALEMARNNLWLGVGFGNFEPAYADYALINWPAPLGHAHNYYLNLLAETGIIGLVAYLLLWTAVFWQTIRLLKRLEWPHRGIALGLLAAWTAVAVHHLVDKLYVNNIYIHLGVMLALLQLLDQETKDCETGDYKTI
jgi:O-antigen ligase